MQRPGREDGEHGELAREGDIDQQVAVVRRFNRYYFRRMAFLKAASSARGLNTSELRVIRLLGEATDGMPAAAIAGQIGMDPGALCRLLARFGALDLVSSARDPRDGRMRILRLTPRGRVAYRDLVRSTQRAVRDMLQFMMAQDRAALVAAMRTVEEILRRAPELPN
jgi:DNA-binding MarR family transcriptional regulator